MMSVTIDPSEMRGSPRPAKDSAHKPRVSSLARTLVLAGLGGAGIVGFSIAAYSMLGGLAGPQIAKVAIGRQAADWPDLKDGMPALVGSLPRTPAAPVAPPVAAARPLPETPPRMVQPAEPVKPVAAAPASVKPTPRPVTMEPAEIVADARIAPLVTTIRTASLVDPRPAETVRARATTTSFAALPAEPAVRPVPSPVPAPVQAARPARKPVASKPAAPQAETAVAPAAPPADAEETEVFGVKVPSLAPAGRRFVEGVQALGDAVKALPEKF